VAVSCADPIETRPSFSAHLDRIEGDRTVILEVAGRFARDLNAQELGVPTYQPPNARNDSFRG
jgi:hypothetical protein